MPDETELKLRKYVDAVRWRHFEEPHRGIFPRIPDLGRRIFALQRYLGALEDPRRGASWIAEQTAMTEEEFAEWQDSPDFAVQSRELRSIIARFAAANPEHRLVAGSRFRSLDAQIRNWNRNGTVGTHAPNVLARARRQIGDAARYPDLGPYQDEESGLLAHIGTPLALPAGAIGLAMLATLSTSAEFGPQIEERRRRTEAIERFAAWLAAQRTGAPSVTVATPGLSNHGVGQAVDFQVRERGGGRIAGASNPGHWRSSGWADRLADAVRPSAHFDGPLRVPDEPWHWTFDPTP